jgi:arylsulfatase A-like enzyme/Flp pilus assembly protein TadD
MRRFAAIALLALAACRRESAEVFRRAPVVLISVDTMRSDHLPAYGYAGVKTPNIDALRRESILYRRAYSHCPMTLPSHLSILTGLLPVEHGVRNNIGYRFDGVKFRTLATVLRGSGYRTGAAVSSYVLRSDTGIAAGFDSYDDSIAVAAGGALSEHQRSGYDTLRAAQGWVGQNASQPFFYFFHIYEPHAPYEPSYDGEIAKADDIVGRLVATLKQSGVYDRAIVVFLSDHGEGLWQHGEDQHGILLYRESLQVPLLVKLPHALRGNTTVDRPTGLAEVFPMLLDLLGIEKNARAPKAIYAETLYPRIHLGWSELRGLIDARFHYIDGPRPELYDLTHDAAETNDLAGNERRTAASMRAALAQFPSEIAPLQNVDAEEAAKLAALGYVGSPKTRGGPLPNPRDQIGHLAEIKNAFHLADQRRYDDAVDALRALLRENPRLADVWSKLGEVLVESRRYDEAIDAYKSAMAQSEIFSPDLALGLGFAYLEAGRPQDAVAHAELALKAAPRESHELLARAYAAEGHFAESEASARQAIAEGDRQPSSILLLAEVQRAEGRLEEALRTIDEAERRAGDLEIRHLYGIDYMRGDVLARLDRPDDAVAAYEREIDASPRHLQSYANLAVIYFIEGKRAEAEKTLALMTRNNPNRGARSLEAKTRAAIGLPAS